MKNTLDPLSTSISGQITCHYVNATSKLQIVRIENIANWYFERVVFPGQHLMFQALPEGVLEVHTSDMATTILADRVACTEIRYTEVLEPLPFESCPRALNSLQPVTMDSVYEGV